MPKESVNISALNNLFNSLAVFPIIVLNVVLLIIWMWIPLIIFVIHAKNKIHDLYGNRIDVPTIFLHINMV